MVPPLCIAQWATSTITFTLDTNKRTIWTIIEIIRPLQFHWINKIGSQKFWNICYIKLCYSLYTWVYCRCFMKIGFIEKSFLKYETLSIWNSVFHNPFIFFLFMYLSVFYPLLVKIVTSKRKHNWLIFSYLEKERKWCSGKDKFLDGPNTAETVTTTNWRTFSKILIFSSKLQFQYSFYNSTSIYIEYVAINAVLWTKYKYFMQNST